MLKTLRQYFKPGFADFLLVDKELITSYKLEGKTHKLNYAHTKFEIAIVSEKDHYDSFKPNFISLKDVIN